MEETSERLERMPGDREMMKVEGRKRKREMTDYKGVRKSRGLGMRKTEKEEGKTG